MELNRVFSPLRRRPLFAGTVGVLVLVVGIAAASSAWIRREIRLSVTRESTPYTELYFTAPTNIPVQVPVRSSAPVRFTIADHEGKAMRYRYVVTVSAPGASRISRPGQVDVRAGGAANLVVPVRAARAGLRCTVTVLLTDVHESIHFHARSVAR